MRATWLVGFLLLLISCAGVYADPPVGYYRQPALSANTIVSERNGRPAPGLVPQAGSRDGSSGIAPAVTTIQPRTSAEKVQHALALRIDVKEPHDPSTLPLRDRLPVADQLVVVQTAVSQTDGSEGRHPDSGATRQTRPEHERVQQVAVQTDVGVDGTVVERARNR